MDDEYLTDVLNQLVESRHLEDIIKRYHLLIKRVYDTILVLTREHSSETITHVLDAIEECDSQVREYIYEEMGATIGDYDSWENRVRFDDLPPELRLIPNPEGFSVVNLPVWMLGHGAKKTYHPMYHKGRPFIRKRQLWHGLFYQLKMDHWAGLNPDVPNLIPSDPPKYSRMIIVFKSQREYEIQDLDHYLGPLEAVVNGLGSNRLICSDRPGYFSYAIDWMALPAQQLPKVDLHVQWSEVPFRPWPSLE